MNGDKVANELLAKATLGKSFLKAITCMRKKYGLPPNGFTNEHNAGLWLKDLELDLYEFKILKKGTREKASRALEFDDDLIEILRKFNLPTPLMLNLRYYFLTNKLNLETDQPYFACAIDYPAAQNHWLSHETYWKRKGEKYVRLLIHKSATRPMVIDFINKNWGEIRLKLNSFKPEKQKRIRVRTTKERNDQIYELSLKTNLELGMKSIDKYRDVVIARIMNERGFDNVTSDIVRKVISQQGILRAM